MDVGKVVGRVVKWTAIGVVVCFLGMVAIYIALGGQIRKVKLWVHCRSQLQGIGNAIAMYHKDFGGRNPSPLWLLVELEEAAPKTFFCPLDEQYGMRGCSYVYRGEDLGAGSPGEMVVMYDEAGNHLMENRNVLFADGRAERLEEEAFLAVIARDNELRREMGLAEKVAERPVDASIPTREEWEIICEKRWEGYDWWRGVLEERQQEEMIEEK